MDKKTLNRLGITLIILLGIASTAISLIPGDAGTPIADQLANFSTYFLIVLSALFFEQYFALISAAQNNELSSADVEDAGILSQLTNSAEATISNAGNYLSQLIRALAVMVVVTCLIPILILVLAFWLLKFIITQNYSVPTIGNIKYLLEKYSEEKEV